MTDKRKNNPGQPKKPPQELKVPLTVYVKARNKERIKNVIKPIANYMNINDIAAAYNYPLDGDVKSTTFDPITPEQAAKVVKNLLKDI